MKIESNPYRSAVASDPEDGKSRLSRENVSPSADDASSLSVDSTNVQSLTQHELTAQLRSTKVEALRSAISNRQYQLDATATADSILREFGKARAQ